MTSTCSAKSSFDTIHTACRRQQKLAFILPVALQLLNLSSFAPEIMIVRAEGSAPLILRSQLRFTLDHHFLLLKKKKHTQKKILNQINLKADFAFLKSGHLFY